MFTQIEKFLSGKKTYGQVALALLLIAAVSLKWIDIDQETYNYLLTALGFGSIAALRAASK